MNSCTSQELVTLWLRVADRVASEREDLNELDRIAGDGDHGENLHRGFSSLTATFSSSPPSGLADCLETVGSTLMADVAGSAGFLLGSAFGKAGVVLRSREHLDAGAVHAALDAAQTVIAARGGAGLGDKTMLDALIPAAAATGELAPNEAPGRALTAAATAARAGATATADLIATKGRASYVGERGRGSQDPGATSLALILTAVAVWESRD